MEKFISLKFFFEKGLEQIFELFRPQGNFYVNVGQRGKYLKSLISELSNFKKGGTI